MKKGLTLPLALNSSDGLAVIGVFFARGNDGDALRPLEDSLQATYAFGETSSLIFSLLNSPKYSSKWRD